MRPLDFLAAVVLVGGCAALGSFFGSLLANGPTASQHAPESCARLLRTRCPSICESTFPSFPSLMTHATEPSVLLGELVIAHCDEPLHPWLMDVLDSVRHARLKLIRTTILTKCNSGEAMRIQDRLNETWMNDAGELRITRLPNVGREAHAFITRIIESQAALAPAVLFLKASWHSRTPSGFLPPMPLDQLIADLRRDGFSCGHRVDHPLYVPRTTAHASQQLLPEPFATPPLVPPQQHGGGLVKETAAPKLVWHKTATLFDFSLDSHEMVYDRRHSRKAKARPRSGAYSHSNHTTPGFTSTLRPLRRWARAMLPHSEFHRLAALPVLPVCYGGVFAVRRNAIRRLPRSTWRVLRRGLGRADNIEEGHFMERLWAPLLCGVAAPLSTEDMDALMCATVHRVHPGVPNYAARVEPAGPLKGLLGLCTCTPST